MPYNKSERPDSPMRRRGGRRRKKVCAFCANENKAIHYNDVATLTTYVSERGKFFLEESQETVLDIRELLQQLSREQEISH